MQKKHSTIIGASPPTKIARTVIADAITYQAKVDAAAVPVDDTHAVDAQ